MVGRSAVGVFKTIGRSKEDDTSINPLSIYLNLLHYYSLRRIIIMKDRAIHILHNDLTIERYHVKMKLNLLVF